MDEKSYEERTATRARRKPLNGHKLSKKKIEELPVGMHRIDKEKGLYISVTKAGSRSWIYLFSFKGKQFKMALGSAKDVPFLIARQRKNECEAELLKGNNPKDIRAESKAQQRAANAIVKEKPLLFKDWWKPTLHRIELVKQWKNQKHAKQWYATIETYALPVLGKIPVGEITTKDILRILEPIWVYQDRNCITGKKPLGNSVVPCDSRWIVKRH